MNEPSLSVIIPNYNHSHYIGGALEAILSQSRLPDEVVIVDDASTDNSVQVIRDFIRRDPRIKLIQNEHNLGVIRSAARGFQAASGTYAYLASADDEVLPGFFEKALAMAVRYPEAGIVFGKMVSMDQSGNELFTYELKKWQKPIFFSPVEFRTAYLESEPATHSLSGATIYKRKYVLEVNPERPELHSWCDTFILRAVALKYGACYVPERFMKIRLLPGSFSASTGRDPKRISEIAKAAVQLMRSPEFKDRFPEEHVTWWEKDFKMYLFIRNLLAPVRAMFGDKKKGKVFRSLALCLLQILTKCSRFLWLR